MQLFSVSSQGWQLKKKKVGNIGILVILGLQKERNNKPINGYFTCVTVLFPGEE